MRRDQRRHVGILVLLIKQLIIARIILLQMNRLRLNNIKIVKGVANQIKEVVAVIQVLQILHAHDQARHRGQIELELMEVVLVQRHILEKQIDMIQDALTVEAVEAVRHLLILIRIRIDQLKLATLIILTNLENVVGRGIRISGADELKLNAVRAEGGHLCDTFSSGRGATQFLPGIF